jgi:glyoxylase-like metal-dependent hydrolase (beta-lactamase superfamily II)
MSRPREDARQFIGAAAEEGEVRIRAEAMHQMQREAGEDGQVWPGHGGVEGERAGRDGAQPHFPLDQRETAEPQLLQLRLPCGGP